MVTYTYRDIYRNVYMYRLAYTLFPFCQQRVSKSKEHTCIPDLFLKFSPVKPLCGLMAESSTRAGNIQEDSGISHSTRK